MPPLWRVLSPQREPSRSREGQQRQQQEKSPQRVTLVGGAEHLPFASEMRLNGALMKALIVPRGLSEDYYFFLRVSAEANNVELIVDRRKLGELRCQERPVPAERRVADRRRPLPRSWQTDGFISVDRREPSDQG